MSLRASQENFQKAFKSENKNLTKEFLNELRKYLQPRRNVRGNAALLKCIKGNKPLASFVCRNDICSKLELEMMKRKIPFVVVTNKMGENGFVIRMEDRPSANDAIQTTLKKLGERCEVITGQELSEIDKGVPKGEQGLLAVNGLSYKEMRMLEKLCKENGFLDYIAEDKMSDDTYRFMVRGSKAVENNQMAISLCRLVMMIEGKNSVLNAKRIGNEIKVEELRFNNFGRGSNDFQPVYVVGNGNEYVKIEQNKFSYGHAVKNGNGVNYINSMELNDTTKGYQAYEASYLNRIQNCSATTDINQVHEHFNRADGTRDSLGYGMTDEERDALFGENALVSGILSIVIDNASQEDIMGVSGRWVEKTRLITSEAGRFLQGMIKNEVPEGYTELDMMEVKNNISDYNIDLSDYESVSDVMMGMIITNEKDSLENVQENVAEPPVVNDAKNMKVLTHSQDEGSVR